MKTSLVRAIAAALAILALVPLPLSLHYPRASAQTAPAFTPEQLDQMLAPIALYPDPLLGEILMAATYPLEVSAAAQWVQSSGSSGASLASAAQGQDWDPSVISLVAFPQILQMMSSQLQWMQSVGDAFLAQQSDVMDSVQRLRRAAQAAGTLASGPQISVTSDGQDIQIEPTSSSDVYVPCYNPGAVFGAWPYAGYPPVQFAPWSGCTIGAALAYGAAFAVFGDFWGWDSWDWRGHRIRIDAGRFNRIDRNRRPFSGDTWQHDPYHRRGVAYRDAGTRARYTGGQAAGPAASRDARGYAAGAPAAARPAPHPGPMVAAPPRGAPAPSAPAARPAARPAAPARPAPPAFSSMGNGSAARAQAARGQASLAAPPRAAPPPRAAAPARPAAPASRPAAAPGAPGAPPRP